MKAYRSATRLLVSLLTFSPFGSPRAAQPPAEAAGGDRVLAAYFRVETRKLAERCLTDVSSLDQWSAHREAYRQQLLEMLGLSPLPERTDLKPVVTGSIDHDTFRVENVHFQSRPGLYVTGNLYLPKGLQKPAPAILYVCGHAAIVTNKVSYGNKTAYQHHGIWFAQNGYVCLVIDSLQLGEIQGLHHGTSREGLWWWNSRGYTPAGVEAWNCVRALDYLQTRPEVDPSRFGVTGRSGGGAYSWWLAAIDDRVKVAAPVAGITDLQNHVVDGCVEGHCDCMFMVNTYRWDYAQVAALVAPRALLIANSDKDDIFPLDGVVRLHAKVRRIYERLQANNKLGLLLTEGPHKDTQDLQLPVFRWFNRHLKGEDPVIEMATTRLFTPQQLKVFDRLPEDQINTRIQESFVPVAKVPPAPTSVADWTQQRNDWLRDLEEKVFAGWPAEPEPLDRSPVFSVVRDRIRFRAFDFTSQAGVRLRLYLLQWAGLRRPRQIQLEVLGATEWTNWVHTLQPIFGNELRQELALVASTPANQPAASEHLLAELRREGSRTAHAFVAPRGIGLTAWTSQEPKAKQLRRRFMMLGQTLDGMRVWDVRRTLEALRSTQGKKEVPFTLSATGAMAVNVLYASLWAPNIAALHLQELPSSHQIGPDYLNVLRFLEVPQAVAMAAERSEVHLYHGAASAWDYPAQVAAKLGWAGKFSVETASYRESMVLGNPPQSAK
jgi:dienelactone hydrolase